MILADASLPSTGVSWLDSVLFVVGIIGALGGCAKVIRDHVSPFLKAISHFLDDWAGEPARPGYAGRTGVMSRLAQLENNGGGSVKDAVDRIEKTVDHNGRQMVAHAAQLAEHIEQSNALIAQGELDKRTITDELARIADVLDEPGDPTRV